MKTILSVALLAFTTSCFAQDTASLSIEKTKPTQELGILLENGGSENSVNNFGLMGIQYKRYKNEHLGYRLFAAYGSPSFKEPHSYVLTKADTFITHSEIIRGDMGVIGGGLEAQRHFYKNVYLFAALELKGGYGTGYVDTIVEKTYTNTPITNQDYGTNYRGHSGDLKITFASFTPTIGAKIQHRKMVAGVELLPVHFTIRNINYHNSYSTSDMNFDLLDFSTRLFVNYVF
jgi:hypothetical protein